MSLAYASIAPVRDRIARGELSSEELVREQLERIDTQTALGTFITVCADEAFAAAREADRLRSQGGALGALHGVPVSAKDIVHSAHVRTTSGSKIFADFVPERDAPCLAALRAAGAVLLGKTNLHEIAFGITNINPHFGAARNPWDRERICGGSSGGSAASLAAGLGYGSIGSDTGGSIRIPSSLCGVVGLKPTYDRVSRVGVTPLSWSLDHIGPMARTVEDVAILYDALTGSSTELSPPSRGLKLGIHERYFFDNLSPEVERRVRAAIETLENLGLEPVTVDIPEVELQAACRNAIAFSEASSFHERNIRERPEDYGEDTRELLRLGLMISATEYLAATRARRKIARAFREAFRNIDLLVAPATPAAAPRAGEQEIDNGEELRAGLMRMATPFNTTGLPALSMPCGFTEDGRPIGLQIAAGPRNEGLILQVAKALESTLGVHGRHPVI